MSFNKKTSPNAVVKTEGPDDESSQSSSASIKRETDSDDGFDEFPAGATPYTRDQLLARMDAREHGILLDMDETSRDSFDDCVATPMAVPAPAAPQPNELLTNTILPEVERFIANDDNVSLTTSIITAGERTEVKFTLVKTPTKINAAETNPEAHGQSGSSQLRAGSSNSFRRSRGVSPPEEVDTSRVDPDDDPNRTPKKRSQLADPNVTPSPAKKLRTLNLNVSESEGEDEELEEEAEDEEETQETDDTDSEYHPDTQEERDRPADFRIPKNAPADPLDLDY